MIAVESSTGGTEATTALATWMTCVNDRHEHAVLEPDFAAGVTEGLYRGACGHPVIPRALASPCGTRCSGCLATLDERPSTDRRTRSTTSAAVAQVLSWLRRCAD